MVRCTDRPAMTITVDLGRKAIKQTNLPGLRLKQPISKCPGRGQNDPLPLQCDSGKSRKFIEKTTHQHRFQDNSTTFSETIHQQHFFLDFELKIITVSVN